MHAGSKFLPVVGVGHVIELDNRRIAGIGGTQAHKPARLGAHGPDVNLEAVGRRRGFAIVAHRYGKKVILHIGILHSGTGANEGAGFEMVGGAEPALEQEPFESNAAFRKQTKLGIQRDRQQALVLEVNLQVIMEIFTHAGEMLERLDAHRF